MTMGCHVDIGLVDSMLSLTVREITTVSATFVLSSRWDDTPLVSLCDSASSSSSSSSDADSDGEGNEGGECKDYSEQEDQTPTLADTLNQGLSVTVNGTPWSCAFVKVDEQLDEAVVIVYALMPGRVYEVGIEIDSPNSQLESRTERTKTKKKEDMDGKGKKSMGVKGKFITLGICYIFEPQMRGLIVL